MKLYLSGPITDVPDDNRPEFERVAALLRGMGHTVFSPIEIEIPWENPSWDDYMDICKPEVDKADALVVLSNWGPSRGARIECILAKQQSKTIYHHTMSDQIPMEVTK